MKNLVFATFFLCLLFTAGMNVRVCVYAATSGFEPMSFDWTDKDLRSVFMLDSSDGWAVGQTILHWNGATWRTVPSPTGSNLMSIHMVNATDGWAVGTEGTTIHWDGTAWSEVASPTSENLYGVYIINATEGWAVGWNGIIIRWNGTAWSIVTSPTSNWLKSVFMVNATDGWAVSGAYGILRWNGTAWKSVTSPTSSGIHSVFMVNATKGWAVGSYGTIIHWNGTAWSNFTSPTPHTLRSVFMLNATDGWIVGDQDILHYNGTTWNSVTKPATSYLFSVFMVDAFDGWAVGDFGLILHWNGVEWVVSKSPLYLGDLHLSGDGVYVIEGTFNINGSMIVEENATLILRNAYVNFTQSEDHQFNLTLRNPAYGNPRLIIENASISTNGYDLFMSLYGNSTGSIEMLNTVGSIWLRTFDDSYVSVSNSFVQFIHAFGTSNFNLRDSTSYATHIYDDSSFEAHNCTIDILTGRDDADVYISNCSISGYITVYAASINCSIDGLNPGYFGYWDFKLNCSVTVTVGGEAPNVTVVNSYVDLWSLSLENSSNATISNSTLHFVYIYDSTVVSAYAVNVTYAVITYQNSKLYAYNSSTNYAYSYDNSEVWAINSMANYGENHDQSRTYVCWYLNVHVVDMNSDDVPYANVTVNYQNGTVAYSYLADSGGWAKFILVQLMTNATGAHPYGNYTVTATYATHSANATIDMTENKQITLMLEDFVIPEFQALLILPLFMIATLAAAFVLRRKHTPL